MDRQYLFDIPLVALRERFAHTNDRVECRLVRGTHLAIDDLVGLAKKRATFAVPEHNVMHK